MPLDPNTIAAHLAAADGATNSDARGRAFEVLIEYLFQCVPGCVTARDIVNPGGAEQIDVAVLNRPHPDGLAVIGTVLLVECKDWDHPVSSSVVSQLLATCLLRRIDVGVLVAASGITGDPQERTFAHSIGQGAVAQGVTILVITREDIEGLSTTEDWVLLLIQRFLSAKASGGLGAPI